MSGEDEFDAIPDEFEGLDFDSIPNLSIDIRPADPAQPSSPNSSSHYSCDDDIDEHFLVEMDAIEDRITQGIRESVDGLFRKCVFASNYSLLSAQRILHIPYACPGSSVP